MSTQQVLLIVLAVLIIGISIAIAMLIFHDQALSASREGITNDLLNLSIRARQYYARPKNWGGGEKSFRGLSMKYLTSHPRNSNGTYSVVSAQDSKAILRGVGMVATSRGIRSIVTLVVFPDSVFVTSLETSRTPRDWLLEE